MSHLFGRSGPPDIKDTFPLLVLNITFRPNICDNLFPLFDKYEKVVDVFIPRDRRTGDSRGFAFVRYKYAEEAQKQLRSLMVSFWLLMAGDNGPVCQVWSKC
ncbi:serine/arginine-rich splicing factor SC35-like [Impatiens glandulifera]|uniref:serine/arginine-rich splicing factor SC35-like n=1 Tax=Impatiens glandulifera TaxID=253017 RepID=UPI001FB0993E|nr:serine/arginine-rich splicing factor SC35-like [Impatiens glandulifera]